MTATKAPGTVDFMPPEMLTKCPDQLYDVFVFSFAEIVIHTLTQNGQPPLSKLKTMQKKGISIS